MTAPPPSSTLPVARRPLRDPLASRWQASHGDSGPAWPWGMSPQAGPWVGGDCPCLPPTSQRLSSVEGGGLVLTPLTTGSHFLPCVTEPITPTPRNHPNIWELPFLFSDFPGASWMAGSRAPNPASEHSLPPSPHLASEPPMLHQDLPLNISLQAFFLYPFKGSLTFMLSVFLN